MATLPLGSACATQVAGGQDLASSSNPSIIDGGIPDGGSCLMYCKPLERCVTSVNDMGQTLIYCFVDHTGRRPATLMAAAPASGTSELGRWFASMAHLEAASVYAFRTLAEELRAHGAPAYLVDAARAAASDEARHARLTGMFARAFGARPSEPRVGAAATRTLAELAVENAAEGCVRESFGALAATFQARSAGDKRVRRALATIAGDETRHAELAWTIDDWAHARLSAAERARVAAAREQALAQLGRELGVEPPAELHDRAGVPSARQARALFDAFAGEVTRRSV